MDKIKQVIVIRKDLNMRKGKIASQAAHASMKVLLDRRVNTGFNDEFIFHMTPEIKKWLSGKFTKIVVSVDSEEELMALYERALSAQIPCALVEDEGLTEFNGVKTKTCIAIGPDYSSVLNQLTGNCPLL